MTIKIKPGGQEHILEQQDGKKRCWNSMIFRYPLNRGEINGGVRLQEKGGVRKRTTSRIRTTPTPPPATWTTSCPNTKSSSPRSPRRAGS